MSSELTLEPVNTDCCRMCKHFSSERVWRRRHHEDYLGDQYNCVLFGEGFHDKVLKFASWNGDTPSNCKCKKFEKRNELL